MRVLRSRGQKGVGQGTIANDSPEYVMNDARAAERPDDTLLAGYDAMKEQALPQADGLLEVWLTPSDQQVVRNRKIA
jgi:hypothetical protein